MTRSSNTRVILRMSFQAALKEFDRCCCSVWLCDWQKVDLINYSKIVRKLLVSICDVRRSGLGDVGRTVTPGRKCLQQNQALRDRAMLWLPKLLGLDLQMYLKIETFKWFSGVHRKVWVSWVSQVFLATSLNISFISPCCCGVSLAFKAGLGVAVSIQLSKPLPSHPVRMLQHNVRVDVLVKIDLWYIKLIPLFICRVRNAIIVLGHLCFLSFIDFSLSVRGVCFSGELSNHLMNNVVYSQVYYCSRIWSSNPKEM